MTYRYYSKREGSLVDVRASVTEEDNIKLEKQGYDLLDDLTFAEITQLFNDTVYMFRCIQGWASEHAQPQLNLVKMVKP